MYGFVISCFTFNGTLRPATIKDESREMLDQILTLKEQLPPTLNISANISIYINPNDNVITPKANEREKTNIVDPEIGCLTFKCMSLGRNDTRLLFIRESYLKNWLSVI